MGNKYQTQIYRKSIKPEAIWVKVFKDGQVKLVEDSL